MNKGFFSYSIAVSCTIYVMFYKITSIYSASGWIVMLNSIELLVLKIVLSIELQILFPYSRTAQIVPDIIHR